MADEMDTRLNTLSPAPGSHKSGRRVGRGIGSGRGKTCGRGHKGQNSRSGGGVPAGFEGGQMPLQRRIPKRGFVSRKGLFRAQVRLSDLERIGESEVTAETLRQKGLLRHDVKFVKLIKSGEIRRAVVVKGIPATRGARAAVEAAGGSIVADDSAVSSDSGVAGDSAAASDSAV